MELLPRVKWILVLTSDQEVLPCDQISEALGLLSDRTWTKEDFPLLPEECRHSGWSYSVEMKGTHSIETPFSLLCQNIMPHLKELKHLIQQNDLKVQFVCVIEAVSGDGPEVILEPSSIHFLSELNAQLDFDLYYGDE